MCKEEDIPCSCINSRELQQDRAGRSLLSPPKKAKRWRAAWPWGRRHREGCAGQGQALHLHSLLAFLPRRSRVTQEALEGNKAS